MLRHFTLCLTLLTPALLAQGAEEEPQPDPAMVLRAWLSDYKDGTIRFQKEGRTDQDRITEIDQHMAAVAARDTLPDAKLLFEAAVIDPKPAGATASLEIINFQRELQPWRVQGMAQRHLRTMTQPSILPWLLKKLRAKGIRAKLRARLYSPHCEV